MMKNKTSHQYKQHLKCNMKMIFLTIIIIGLLTSCGNKQNNLTNKIFITETGKGCSKTLGGGCDENYFSILKFQEESKVLITSKISMHCSINRVQKDTTIILENIICNYKIKNDNLIIENNNGFNIDYKFNKLGGITATDRVSEVDTKYYYKEIENNEK